MFKSFTFLRFATLLATLLAASLAIYFYLAYSQIPMRALGVA